MNKPIVVGIDGSAPSRAAQDLAGWEAAMRRRPLRIVHALAWPWPTFHMPDRPPPKDLEAISFLAQANDLVDAAVERARHTHPTITVDGEVMIGFPAPVLSTASQTATMIVIGHRGLGKVDRLLLGSVALQLTAHSTCPVLVSRGRPHPSWNVLLGVDGAASSDAAVGIAFEEAALRGVGVDAIHTWHGPIIGRPGDVLPAVHHPTTTAAAEEHLMATALAEWQHTFPHVATRRRLVRGNAREILINATTQAQLAVVGTHARGKITRLLHHSTSQAVLNHAACPVLVVPDRTVPRPKS
jgi:nucleotide-binding universal stress UspA family protein